MNNVKYNEKGQMLDEAEKTLWERLNDVYKPEEQNEGDDPAVVKPVMRFRPPYNKIATFDMKGDAIQLVIDSLLNHKLPYYVAYVVATNMIFKLKDELRVQFVDYFENAGTEDVVDNAAAWCKVILDRIPLYCAEYIEGHIEIQDRTSAWFQIPAFCSSIQGRRKGQEDRCVCLPSLHLHDAEVTQDVPLFAVFDGHNGSHIAAYAAAHLPFEFAEALKHHENVDKALTATMQRLDQRVCDRSNLEQWQNTGSTAVVAAVTPSTIHIRWLGDSSAFILSDDGIESLTVFHNCNLQREIDRVNAAGGEFIYRDGDTRLQGILSVSRALGDLAMRPALSGESDSREILRTEKQYLLLLVCDGITDVYKPNALRQLIENYMREVNPSGSYYYHLADYVTASAYKQGSSDNCSCIAVYLTDPTHVWNKIQSKK